MWHSRILVLSASLVILVIVALGTLWNRDYQNAKQSIRQLTSAHVPDKREDVADIRLQPGIATLHVEGETSNLELYSALRSSRLTSFLRLEMNVVLLPDTSVDSRHLGIVEVAVANLRRDPRHGAELVDQAILGTELRILKQVRGWYLVKTSWNYLGWVTGSSIHFTQEPIEPTHRVKATSIPIRQSQDDKSLILVDAPYGATLRVESQTGRLARVQLPNGSAGYVPLSALDRIPAAASTISSDVDLMATALAFHGTPYLWGGNSTSGFDCSGFTQTVFKSQGIRLPRDANMQIKIGTEIPITEDFSNVKAGDLIYFGPSPERITHVALSLGGARIIHASEFVRTNSLDPEDPEYAPDRRRTLQAIRRIE